MKKAFLCFVLVLCLTLGLVVPAALSLHQARDQVAVTSATTYGDPTQAAGLTAKQSAHYDNHLRWDLTIPLDRPEDTATAFSSRQPPAEGGPMGPSIYARTPSGATFLSGGTSLESAVEANFELAPLLPLFQEIAQQAPDGQIHSETIDPRDYLDVYPLVVDITVPYAAYRSGDGSMAYLSQVWQDFFAFPIPADERWTITIRKGSQGGIQEFSLEAPATYAPNFLTAYAGERVFFTLDGNSSGACVNTPGGFGIYTLALAEQDGIPWAELDALSNVFPLPQGTVVVDLSASQDGQSLLLTTRLGDACTLRVIDPETMEVKQSFPVSDPNLSGVLLGENFLLLYGEETFHLFSLENGTCAHVFSAPMEESMVQGADYLGDNYLTAAWNGERLAMGASLTPDSSGLVLAVYEAGTLTYLGTYVTSLTEEDDNPWPPSDPVRLVNGAELTLTWE